MKVRIIATNEIVEAKRFKDMTEEEIDMATFDPELWSDDDVFTEVSSSLWIWLPSDEIEIIEEKEDSQCQEQ